MDRGRRLRHPGRPPSLASPERHGRRLVRARRASPPSRGVFSRGSRPPASRVARLRSLSRPRQLGGLPVSYFFSRAHAARFRPAPLRARRAEAAPGRATLAVGALPRPLGFVLRLFGRGELRRRGPAPPSMWSPYPERNRDPRHYETIW